MSDRRKGRVVLSAWVDPVLREYARQEAAASGVGFSEWVERALQQAIPGASVKRALAQAQRLEAPHD